MKLLVVASLAFVSTLAASAPDEDLLGKSRGYPVCKEVRSFANAECVIGAVSRTDEMFPARKIAKGATTRPLRKADKEPAIRYTYSGFSGSVDDYLARNRTTGLLILRDDTILVERYQYDRKPEDRMTSYSMCKTVVAMLVGLAIADGKIRSIDDKVGDYLPELKGAAYGDTPLRHLLTMSSGVRFATNYGGNDDLALLARLSLLRGSEGGVATVMPFKDRERPAGEKYFYSSADTQVLGLVVRAATGRTLSEYLSEKVWQPMGAEADASWLIDKGGYELAFSYLNATLRDWGRFGLLLANDGMLDGKSIIPANWIREATSVRAEYLGPGRAESDYGYGYQTRILRGERRQFLLLGQRGQTIFVDPASKTVLVHTAARGVAEPENVRLPAALWEGAMKTLSN